MARTGWIQLMPVIGNVKGFAAFISSNASAFQLYVRPSISIRKTPLANFHAIELLARSGETDRRIPHARDCGRYKALTAGVLDDKSIWNRRGRCWPSIGGRSMWSSRSFRGCSFLLFEPRSECARDVAADRSASPRMMPRWRRNMDRRSRSSTSRSTRFSARCCEGR